ncbi:hypothetical protein B0H10DRAFT_1948598 [Mycena sp. CBHHK59/15]|nr:hypothetical protein B0H10DRAFT_1948598 [Mycena sp. CBHHK59/15]
MSTGTPRYPLRSLARASSPAAAQHQSEETLSVSSRVGSLAGTPSADREPEALPKSRPTTPELLYSRVVAGVPAPAMESCVRTSTSVPLSENPELSELPTLNPDVDYGLLDSDEGPDEVPWTKVLRESVR